MGFFNACLRVMATRDKINAWKTVVPVKHLYVSHTYLSLGTLV